MEEEMNNMMPLLDCVKDVQNPENIVPIWVNGGEDTRSYINRAEFNKNCNWRGRNKNYFYIIKKILYYRRYEF